MPDPAKNADVEDILSSIRRLVSEMPLREPERTEPVAEPERAGAVAAEEPEAADAATEDGGRLVLTPAHRVTRTDAPAPFPFIRPRVEVEDEAPETSGDRGAPVQVGANTPEDAAPDATETDADPETGRHWHLRGVTDAEALEVVPPAGLDDDAQGTEPAAVEAPLSLGPDQLESAPDSEAAPHEAFDAPDAAHAKDAAEALGADTPDHPVAGASEMIGAIAMFRTRRLVPETPRNAYYENEHCIETDTGDAEEASGIDEEGAFATADADLSHTPEGTNVEAEPEGPDADAAAAAASSFEADTAAPVGVFGEDDGHGDAAAEEIAPEDARDGSAETADTEPADGEMVTAEAASPAEQAGAAEEERRAPEWDGATPAHEAPAAESDASPEPEASAPEVPEPPEAAEPDDIGGASTDTEPARAAEIAREGGAYAEPVTEAEGVAEVEDVAETERFARRDDEMLIDEEGLRELIAEIVREELQGALGERITRNIRKLARREIHRAMTMRELGLEDD